MYRKLLPYLLIALFLMGHTYAVDIIAPTTTYTKTPTNPDGKNGWYKSIVSFELQATDLDSGVKDINYRIDGGSWQTTSFNNTINLAPNPSFETSGATSSGLASWDATVVDAQGTYTRDVTDFLTGYASASAKITSTGGTWHGINNKDTFSATTPLSSMTSSIYVKTSSLAGSVNFKMYSIGDDNTVQLLATSSSVTTDVNWTKLTLDYTVTQTNSVGVYMDVGIAGSGTVYLDAATITASILSTKTNFTVANDNADHTVEFYSVDNTGNAEIYSCVAPIKNCVKFKQDMTPPGNWHDSGAIRGIFGSSHELYVYSTVDDDTSGLSILSDRYTYQTDANPGSFGRFSNLLSCNSTWQPGVPVILITPPFSNGANSGTMITLKTDFCNNDWKTCKTVRFEAEDMAGNRASKDYCINGPWIKFSNEGSVRSNQNISMLSEADGDNTDGLVEASGNLIDFFTSSKNFELKNAPVITGKNYNYFWNLTGSKTALNTDLVASTGVYYKNSNFTVSSSALPNAYRTSNFSQVVFINGDLTINADIDTTTQTAVLFIVSGDVNVAKNVKLIEAGIFAEDDFFTSYNISEGEASDTLVMRGIYKADKFVFQRTLQGTNNNDVPSEDIIYEPKFLLQMKQFFGNYNIKWESGE